MARPLPTTFQPQGENAIGSGMPVGTAAEDVLLDNCHHTWCYVVPTLISQINTTDLGYIGGSGSNVIHCAWNIDIPPEPFSQLDITILYSTTTGAAHTVTFDWESDPAPGTFVDITASGSASQWTVASGALDCTAVADDTLRMWVRNTGGSGEVQVHAVDVRPKVLASIAAGPATWGGLTAYPLDTAEVDQDSPLSVIHRQAQWNMLEMVRRTRPGVVVCWSDNIQVRAGFEAYSTTSSDYQRVITIPFWVPPGVTSVRWSVLGYVGALGTGSVRLTTDDDAEASVAAQEVALGTTWTTPYTAAQTRYDDGGQAALGVADGGGGTPQQDGGKWCELRVDLKSDGTRTAYLMGLCAWFGMGS